MDNIPTAIFMIIIIIVFSTHMPKINFEITNLIQYFTNRKSWIKIINFLLEVKNIFFVKFLWYLNVQPSKEYYRGI